MGHMSIVNFQPGGDPELHRSFPKPRRPTKPLGEGVHEPHRDRFHPGHLLIVACKRHPQETVSTKLGRHGQPGEHLQDCQSHPIGDTRPQLSDKPLRRFPPCLSGPLRYGIRWRHWRARIHRRRRTTVSQVCVLSLFLHRPWGVFDLPRDPNHSYDGQQLPKRIARTLKD